MVDIFRVEHLDGGQGPYWGGRGWIGRADASHGRPLPEADGLDDYPAFYFYGFASMAQLTAWWGKESQLQMFAQGYVISHYRCPASRVIHGQTQVVFDRNASRYLRALCPLVLSLTGTIAPTDLPQWVLDEERKHEGVY